jgi:hypothetical protein
MGGCAILREVNAKATAPDRLARTLRRLGLGDFVAVLLEAVEPLSILGAQAVYLSEPLLDGRQGVLSDFAHILESEELRAGWIRQMRDEEDQP